VLGVFGGGVEGWEEWAEGNFYLVV